MWSFGLRRAGRLALGLLGAILLAAVVAAQAAPYANNGAKGGLLHFFGTVLSRLAQFARFDFGSSAISATPAAQELVQRLPATLELVAAGALVAALIGIPLGIVLSIGRVSRAAAPLIQIVAAAPVFCAALALLWLSVQVLHWNADLQGAPDLWSALASGNGATIREAFRLLALPALTVGAAGAAGVQLALRRAVNEAREAPYRRGLKMMGLSPFEVDRLYLVPQVFAGVLANLGEIALSLFSAAAVAEWVFGWPGAAVLFLRSVALHDWSVVALVLLSFAAITLIAQFLGSLGARALAGIEANP
jgi:peptide/nickel transport system permease protein